MMMTRKISALLSCVMLVTAHAFPQVNVKGKKVDATQGYTYQGTAPVNQTLCGNGTVFVPVANCGVPPSCNANGCFVQFSGGMIFAWGTVSVPASGNYYNTATITFPVAFTTSPVVTPSLIGTYTTDATTPATVQLSSAPTTASAAVYMARTIVAGAGGGNFDQLTTLQWTAVGY